MTLRKFLAFTVFVLIPLTVAEALYISQKYHLSGKLFLLPFFVPLAIITLPVFIKLELRSLREVEKLCRITGLKEVNRGADRRVLVAEGDYGGLSWRLYKKFYNTFYSDELLFVAAKLPEGVDVNRLTERLRALPKVEKVELKEGWLEVVVCEGEVESYRDLLRVMNALLREVGLSPPIPEEGVVR